MEEKIFDPQKHAKLSAGQEKMIPITCVVAHTFIRLHNEDVKKADTWGEDVSDAMRTM